MENLLSILWSMNSFSALSCLTSFASSYRTIYVFGYVCIRYISFIITANTYRKANTTIIPSIDFRDSSRFTSFYHIRQHHNNNNNDSADMLPTKLHVVIQ